MCSYLMMLHFPCPIALASSNSIFKLSQNEPNDNKRPDNIICTMMMYEETFILPPHGTTLAAAKI